MNTHSFCFEGQPVTLLPEVDRQVHGRSLNKLLILAVAICACLTLGTCDEDRQNRHPAGLVDFMRMHACLAYQHPSEGVSSRPTPELCGLGFAPTASNPGSTASPAKCECN